MTSKRFDHCARLSQTDRQTDHATEQSAAIGVTVMITVI